MRFLLLLLLALPSFGNVCVPLNVPAYGPFPAIVNGIDAVDWGVARIQWTSDATNAAPATQQRIQYATAQQWAAHPGSYPQTQGLQNSVVNSPVIIQGSVLPNLKPATTYHVIGQSLQAGQWCSAPDQTFTTLPYRAAVLPQLPLTFDTARPTVKNHDYTYGADCGTHGTPTERMQDCFNLAKPGDGLGIPPGTYKINQIILPHNPNAVKIASIDGSTITSPAHHLANGQQLRFGSTVTIPNPLNPGVTYKVVNATANTFQVSYDGVTPLKLRNKGSDSQYYAKWPLTQNWIVIHSTAPPSSLPPDGVRLDPAAYGGQMPNLQMTDPSRPILKFSELTAYLWFQNVIISTDPAVAAASGNGVDPVAFTVPWATSANNDHIVLNQCAFMPAPPPSRSELAQIDGSNIGILNSYVSGLDFWQPSRNIPAAKVDKGSLIIPAGSYSWVGPGGPVGTRKSCAISQPVKLPFAGSGKFTIYLDPANCNLAAQLQNGLTTSAGITVSTAPSPSYPTFTYRTTSGINITNRNVLPIGSGTVINSSVSAFDNTPGNSASNSEGGEGLHVGSGPGPIMIVNNFITGAGIVGSFLSDDLTDGSSPCGNANPCAVMYNTGNFTEQRNTITTNACYFAGHACWNGGNYYWRNLSEIKQGKAVLQDGNIYGPAYVQIGQGGCAAHMNYYAGFPINAGFINYSDSSDWTFTNNTCFETGEGIATAASFSAVVSGYPMKNVRVRNNLFYKVNAYAQTLPNPPLNSVVFPDHDQPACPFGKLLQWGGNGQNFVFDHNTAYGQGGCMPWFYDQFVTLSSGIAVTSNVFNLVRDTGLYANYMKTGTMFQSNGTFGGSPDQPDCAGKGGSALFSCMNHFTWRSNVVLATWVDSRPNSLKELSAADVVDAKPLMPAETRWPNNSAEIGWADPGSLDFRIKSSSPYAGIGVDMDALDAAQGKVSNVEAAPVSSTSATISFLAPDTFACSVDWRPAKAAGFKRVPNAAHQRDQKVTLAALPAHALISYRVNCAVQQPSGTLQLP